MSAAPEETMSSPDNEASAQEQLLFTADQAAQLLQVRASWLRRRATARAIPCRFLGKYLRFSRDDIDQIAEESKQDVRTGPRTTQSGKTSPAA
ncbi:helix-turn-helix domain-containing protein [Lentzea rhizosphaerae]|uniref:Helix-turn-helix domain-containing protein n=1 Tax=Lentzea rhizosphaerae TaxID=2041025 RepID=A0ABV8BPQ1_9PSEU